MTEQEMVDEIVRRVSISRIEIKSTRTVWDWYVAGFALSGGVVGFAGVVALVIKVFQWAGIVS